MQVWTEIRRKVIVEKVSVRQICRDYGLSHHTVAKMLENVEPPGYQQGEVERPRPKLGPVLGVIDQILEDDQMAPKKQRHTAKRIFERLRDERSTATRVLRVRSGATWPRTTTDTVKYSCRSPNHRARPSSTSVRRSSWSPGCA